MWPKMNYSNTAPKCWNVTSLSSSSFCICAARRSARSRDSIISMPDTSAGGNFLHRYFHFHFRNIETWSKQKIKIEWKQCYWCFLWFECRSPMFYYWVALKLKKYCVVLYCTSAELLVVPSVQGASCQFCDSHVRLADRQRGTKVQPDISNAQLY